jgi:HPt (histidine-containing phosphotransfer) domain-containing protein
MMAVKYLNYGKTRITNPMLHFPQPTGPVFDPSRLHGLIEPSDRHTLLQLFLSTSVETLKRLKEELKQPKKDRKMLKQTLHGLKGAAVSVGATHLAQIAKAIEVGLDNWNDREAEEALAHLEKSLSETEIAIEPWLK